MKHRYSVIVGNVGHVYEGTNKRDAGNVYKEYVLASKSGTGRAGSEPVTLFTDNEITAEYFGHPEETF